MVAIGTIVTPQVEQPESENHLKFGGTPGTVRTGDTGASHVTGWNIVKVMRGYNCVLIGSVHVAIG